MREHFNPRLLCWEIICIRSTAFPFGPKALLKPLDSLRLSPLAHEIRKFQSSARFNTLSMSRPLQVLKAHVSSPKAWIVMGVTVAGVVILAEAHRRRRRVGSKAVKEDFGAFLMRFELLPSPQPPPPALKQPLAGLTFAIKDMCVLLPLSVVALAFSLGCVCPPLDFCTERSTARKMMRGSVHNPASVNLFRLLNVGTGHCVILYGIRTRVLYSTLCSI